MNNTKKSIFSHRLQISHCKKATLIVGIKFWHCEQTHQPLMVQSDAKSVSQSNNLPTSDKLQEIALRLLIVAVFSDEALASIQVPPTNIQKYGQSQPWFHLLYGGVKLSPCLSLLCGRGVAKNLFFCLESTMTSRSLSPKKCPVKICRFVCVSVADLCRGQCEAL